MKSTIVGIDLAKDIFHVCAADQYGRIKWRKRTTRQGLGALLAKLPASTVAMESCAGSHYWGRRCHEYGHVPRLINGKFVKPFVKSNKNDVIDAEAITEAAQRPTMRFVPVKTTQQQDIQALHRVRERLIRNRTALVNQCRGLLLENGIVIGKGRHHLQRQLPTVVENVSDELSQPFLVLIRNLSDELAGLNEQIGVVEQSLKEIARTLEPCTYLISIPGVGYLTATATFAAAGNGSDFKNGRHMAAWIGLVPRQVTTGGKPKLLGISKRGDSYLRKLFIHGARSVLISRKNLGSPQRWARKVAFRSCSNKAAVALANKNARIAWKLLRSGESFRPDYLGEPLQGQVQATPPRRVARLLAAAPPPPQIAK
jgi:transposase